MQDRAMQDRGPDFHGEQKKSASVAMSYRALITTDRALTMPADASAASSAEGRATLFMGMVHTTGVSLHSGAPLHSAGLCWCS